jgi:transcriptional regulator with XRE-family HTH domain
LLGEVIRQIRRSKDLTLQQVAERSGLSTAFLSQVENDQANPTLASVRRIAAALGTSTFALLAQGEAEGASVFIARDRRRTFVHPGLNGSFSIATATYSEGRMQTVVVDLAPKMATCDEAMAHGLWESEEWAMLVQGEVELEVGSERHVLRPGDAVHFRPAIPHRYVNRGGAPASLICVMSPPSF